jgi:hypothetical protein
MIQVTKVWWDGERLMAEPIDPTTIYQEPLQREPDFWEGYQPEPTKPAPVREDWGPGPHEVHSLPSQPAPVQDTEDHYKGVVEGVQKLFDDKRAQPAVPDAIIEAGESPDYRDGWNDCRQTMLEILKARSA